jgi:thioredoxin 1
MRNLWKIIIVLLLVSAVAAVIVLKKKENQPLQTQTNVNNPQPVVVEANKTQKLPRLVDLGADKCIPCKMMKPVLDELGTEYKGILDVVFIDVWKDEAAGKKFGIRVIPTQIFLDPDGKELFRHEGFFSKEDILAKWKKLGFEIKKKD